MRRSKPAPKSLRRQGIGKKWKRDRNNRAHLNRLLLYDFLLIFFFAPLAIKLFLPQAI
jgi:hypothetical protein